MKRIFTKLLAVVLVCGSYYGQAQNDSDTHYFDTKEMPNLIYCLPAPPDTIGEDFAHDIMRYMWGKTQRSDSARMAIAVRDAVWSFGALLDELSVPFGMKISKEGTPEIYNLMVNSLATVDQMRVEPKAHYMRKRPFVLFQEHMYTVYEEADLRNEGSYPSGHSQRGYMAALLLSEVNPDSTNAMLRHGFKALDSEWWHFTLKDEPYPNTYFTFPVKTL